MGISKPQKKESHSIALITGGALIVWSVISGNRCRWKMSVMPKSKFIFPAWIIEGIGGANILKAKRFLETTGILTQGINSRL